jgi:hypothetical protein
MAMPSTRELLELDVQTRLKLIDELLISDATRRRSGSANAGAARCAAGPRVGAGCEEHGLTCVGPVEDARVDQLVG